MAEAPAKDAPESRTSGVEGVFKPPIFSFSGGRPIKLAGPGRCRLTDGGLVVEAFKRKWPQHVKILVGLGFALLLAILALIVPLIASEGTEPGGDSTVWIIALIGPLLLIGLPLIRGYDDHKPDKPVSHTIDWGNVRSVRRGRVTVTIDVAKGRPKGFVYFEPKDDTQSLVKAIRERIRKPE